MRNRWAASSQLECINSVSPVAPPMLHHKKCTTAHIMSPDFGLTLVKKNITVYATAIFTSVATRGEIVGESTCKLFSLRLKTSL